MTARVIVLLFIPALASAADVTGRVRYEGAAPKATVAVGRDKEVCGAETPNDTLVVEDEGLANVVVSIAAPGKAVPTDLAVDVAACRFVPHMGAVAVGSTLAVSNRDALLHRVFATAGTRRIFTWPLAVQDKPRRRALAEIGLVELRCDSGHPWSSAFVHVFDHPHFTVTARDGRFTIPRVPDGTWTVTAWHERLGTQTAQLVVRDGATLDLTFRER